MKKVAIVGAGLAGSLLSVYLAKRGINVEVYEQRPDMRKEDAGGGRSINLALSTRGIHALKEVGLYEEIKKISIPMYGRMVHMPDGTTKFQRYGKDDSEYINSVSRAELNKKLMDLADNFDNINFNFSCRCVGTHFEQEEVRFANDETESHFIIKGEAVIATDGATSTVRQEMLKVPRFNFSQEYENYGYKELTILPGEGGNFRLEKNALHIWPRGSYMLIALPNMDGSFTCTLFLAYDKSFGGENSFEELQTPEEIEKFFDKNFPDASALMPGLVDEFRTNPVGTLITIKCYPWTIGRTTLLGDACHAIVPFFGQGMNAAFEDCTCLNECVGKFYPDWDKVFAEYQSERKVNSDAIADLAQENFIEMRDLVADKRFMLEKEIESELARRYKEGFIPKYSMVTFHRFPYSVALERGKKQSVILHKLSEGKNSIEEIDWSLADELLRNELA